MNRLKNWQGRRAAQSMLAAASVLLLAACGAEGGTNSDPAGSDGLPSVVKLVSLEPLTGTAAFSGESANKGYELAIKQINEQGFLGETTLELEKVDTKTDPQTAAQEFTKITSRGDVSAVFGTTNSAEAVAVSPLAQRAKMPIVYTQSGSEGVVIGEYTYRATPLMSSYFTLLESYLEEKGVKRIGIIYADFSPTLTELGLETIPAMAESIGAEVVSTVAVQATTQSFQAQISQVLEGDPDAVALLVFGAAHATGATQLRQAGFDGPILAQQGAAPNLGPAGEAGNEVVWASDFSAQSSAPSTQEFVEAYKAQYGGEIPLNYAAEAYDAAWFLARALKQANSADREAIKDALAVVAKDTFDGALGTGLSWKDGTLQVPGVVSRWNNGAEELLYEG